MKVKILLLGLLLLSTIHGTKLPAQKVNQNLATQIAQSWIKSHAPSSDYALTFHDSISHNDLASIYLFDIQPKGFIWISANMEFAPVLAYSFESSEDPLDEAHPASDFLKSYQDEMAAHPYESGAHLPHPGWTELSREERLKGLKSDDEVEPMMEVTWGQGAGYNTYTPENTPTGCVAVAMLQLMRHWAWPPQGEGEQSYTHDQYGDFAVNFDTIQFHWASLPLNSPTPEIAKIMLWAGIALHMNYAPGGSGANTERIKELLATNFHYNSSHIRYTALADYGKMSNWIPVVKNELINGRPMVYNGSGTAGHAFNIDGFNDDYFHLNWGWSGAYNGYFLLTSLTPGSNNFSEGQGAVMGAFPDTMLMWDRPFSVRALASDSKVSITWTGIYNRELLAYNIYRDGTLLGQTTDQIYSDTTAQNGSTYTYAISSLYRTDTADYESELSVEFLMTPVAGFKLPFQEDFEEDYDGWQIAGTKSGFKWGTGAELSLGTDTTRHFIGINSAIAGSNVLVSDRLVSNGIDFSTANKVILSFDYMFRKWQNIDHLYLEYKIFEEDEWIQFAELEKTKGYDDWVRYKCYLPQEALQKNVQIGFYYTDNGEVGYGAGLDNIRLELCSNPGVPDFSVSQNTTCVGTDVVYTDLSSGTRETYYWEFGDGADPRNATGPGPHTVSYRSSGEKSVKLVLNELDELVRDQVVTVVSAPRAGFSKSINYKTVTFNNTSYNALAYMWDFGDGVKVTQRSPSHVYALSGDYRVQLIAINHTCENDTIQQWISIKITGKEDLLQDGSISLFPNPADDWLNIQFPYSIDGEVQVGIYNLEGKLIKNQVFHETPTPETIQLNISQLPKGSYFIRLTQSDRVVYLRFVK